MYSGWSLMEGTLYMKTMRILGKFQDGDGFLPLASA